MGNIFNVIGHTPVEHPVQFKDGDNGTYNHIMIDTGCVFQGDLTAIDLDTGKIYQA